MRTPLLITALLTALLVAVMHIAAYEFYLYWHYWWFDILMHGLGGVALASIALWLYLYAIPRGFVSVVNRFLFVLAAVVVLGTVWEFFEFGIGSQRYQTPHSYLIDTMSDMGMDIVGALIVYLASLKIRI